MKGPSSDAPSSSEYSLAATLGPGLSPRGSTSGPYSSALLYATLPSLGLGKSARSRPTLRGLNRSEAGRRGGEL